MLEFPAIRLALQCRLPRFDHTGHLFGGLVRELETELLNARVAPLLEVLRTGLRLRSKDRVAASDIGHDWMLEAMFVSQCDGVCFARMTAVGVIGAARKEAAEDAMLGVKDRQVVVCDHLERSRIDPRGEIRNLLRIQVMRRRKFLETHAEEVLGGDTVRGIEREIAVQYGSF